MKLWTSTLLIIHISQQNTFTKKGPADCKVLFLCLNLREQKFVPARNLGNCCDNVQSSQSVFYLPM